MTSTTATTTLVIAFALVGCRQPLAEEKGTDTGKGSGDGDFDASVGDGGAPVADCILEDATHRFDNNFSPYFGGSDSVEVEVVHFSSFSCPHCAHFAEETAKLWDKRADFRKRVRVYFHHSSSSFRHRAAVAAHNQGMKHFWALHDFIYEGMLGGETPSDEDILAFVEERGLDLERFSADLEAEKTYSFLEWDDEQGMTAGVTGTPTAFVCGERISYSQLEEEVDEYLP